MTVFTATLVAGAGDLLAQKTDKVVLYRGDTITGSIKGMSRGRLDYSTDDMKRVSIEWNKVARIESKDVFEIELSNAKDYAGAIEFGDEEGEMVIVSDSARIYLRIPSVVRITPLGSSFLKKLSGRINLGLDITRAKNQRIWNSQVRLTFRSLKWWSSMDATSYLNAQNDSQTSRRNAITVEAERLVQGANWSILASFRAEQNDELNLERRLTARLQYGTFFKRTNRAILQGFVGVAGLDESFTGDDPHDLNLEALGAVNFELFKFSHPEVDIALKATGFAGLSDWGRFRTDIDLNATWEVVKDLDVGFRGYVQADTDPGSDASKLDYALTTTVGYSWD
jgi:hypothetical protein